MIATLFVFSRGSSTASPSALNEADRDRLGIRAVRVWADEEGDRLEVLSILVETYETRHYPIDLPDPVEAIKFHMESAGLTVKDLEPVIGRSNRVYEVLDRTGPLTLRIIRNLHESLGIPAESLIMRPQHA